MSVLLRALVFRYIAKNALRSLVTAVAVMLGVALVFAIDLANATAVASFSSSVNVIANRVNLQIVGAGNGFAEKTLLSAQRVDGVAAAYPIVEGELIVGERPGDPQSGEVLRVSGMDATQPLPQAVANASAPLDLGRFINGNGVIVSERIAKIFSAPAGSTLSAFSGVHKVLMHVSAVLPARGVAVDSSVAFVDVATAQDLFAKIGSLDRIDIVVDPHRLASVESAIRGILPAGTRVVRPATRTDEIKRLLRSFRLNLEALSYVALLVGMFLIYNAVAISVVQRRPEIATVRALGASKRAIFAVFVAEGGLYGFVGTAAGLVAGAILARGAVQAVSHTVSTLYVGSHADAIVFTLGAFEKAIAGGLGSALLSAALPAWAAASIRPAIAMRSSVPDRVGARSMVRGGAIGAMALLAAWILSRMPAIDGVPVYGFAAGIALIAGAALCVPLVLLATLRCLGAISNRRVPFLAFAIAAMRAALGRYAVAVASLAVAVAMMTSIAILVTSFRATIVSWAQQTLQADLFLKPPGATDASSAGRFDPAFVSRVSRVRGVSAVDTFRGFAIPFRGGITYLGSTDFASFGSRSKVSFTRDIDVAALAHRLVGSNEVLASEPFAVRYGLAQGDAFPIETPSGPVRLTIAATYNDYSTDAGAFIMDQRTYRKLYHDRSVDSIAVYLRPGASLPDVRSRILRSVAPARIDIESSRELRTIVLGIFDRTFAITNALYVVSIAIAVLGVVSTLFALVLERRRDIAVLRYLGVTAGGIRRMVYAQAAVVGITAAWWGIALGVALSLLLVFVINFQSFGWVIALRIPYRFFFEVACLITLAALLAGVYPADVAARIQTAEALRDE
ncbi:MAG: FtsX-like permease family protein [Candidatus Eremiobacteraeota bacterium]|nr:FtsX-like permease family protein [Candidatus Eremiobacteraeota bacterium]